jgi:hypothetical protein
MTYPYCCYRLRFHPEATREQLRDTIADLVMLLHSSNVWPSVLYPAGASKKQAMKRAFDLTSRDAVLQLAEKIIGTRRWPEIGGGRYWSDTGDEDGEDRFVLNFSGWAFGAKWFNMAVIEHSPRFADGFRVVIDQLGRTAATPFVVFALSREDTGEILQASIGDGVWLDAWADASAVTALARLTERD